jgi:hypothetical protein
MRADRSCRHLFAIALALLGGASVACSGGNASPDAGDFMDAMPVDLGLGRAGGFVTGNPDMHCEGRNHADGGINIVDQNACNPPTMDAGTSTTTCPFGDTNFNNQALDDDCKYNVTYGVTEIYENYDVTFNVTVTRLADNMPVTGANTQTEIFLSSNAADPCSATHPAPNANTQTTEPSPGTYHISPVRFDQQGRWTVRFHFFENCYDQLTSPHGHAAFFVDVP